MELEKSQSIFEQFVKTAKTYKERVVYSQAQIEGADLAQKRWESHAYKEVYEKVLKISSFLKKQGVSKGDRIAIISGTRPEWLEADLAVLSLGAVVVSVYQSLPPEEIGYILFDSGARLAFVENQEQLNKLFELEKKPCPIAATEERPACEELVKMDHIICFEQVEKSAQVSLLSEILLAESLEDSQKIEFATVEKEDLATLVYTSGTTGPPKGVMQSHLNHLANIRQARECGLFSDSSTLMLFLPLAHSFARLIGYVGFLTGAGLRFPAVVDRLSSRVDPQSISSDISSCGASIVPLVPRLLEKIQEGIQKKAGSGAGGKVLKATLWSAAQKQSGQASALAQIVFMLCRPIRAKLKRRLFGDSFEYAVSGGAKLSVETHSFFDSLGIEILEGYGLTETCVATNVNRIGQKKIGTVGPVLSADIELRIAEDGEILFKGPNVAAGYYQRPQATKEAWDQDGWFHTGDLGALDEEGFLKIVGRKKEIIVTSKGKNIAPEGIEQKLKGSFYISQVVVVGDDKPYLGALITLDKAAVRSKLAKTSEVDAADFSQENQALKRLLEEEIKKVNLTLTSHEQIKRFRIIPEEFTVENGLLTPTFKVKRKVVLKQYAEELVLLYS
jgi:long-chain acyl-CoA synthetase